MAEFVAALEEVYVENRSELLCEDGSIRSPLFVLRELAYNYGTPVHLEIHELHISNSEKAYQTEIYVGRLRGRGEAPRRKLSMQIAAADVLDKVKSQQQTTEIPLYGLVPGSRIPPTIFADLLAVCEALGTSAPFYVHIPDDPEGEPEHLFTYKCQIGQLYRLGQSDSRFIAKRLAAKKVYEALTEGELLLDPVGVGADCHLLEKYKIVPQNSQKKIDIMKYRQECREREAQASTADATSTSSNKCKEEEDDFGDDNEMDSANPDDTEGVAERVGRLNLNVIRARVANLQLGEQELQTEDD